MPGVGDEVVSEASTKGFSRKRSNRWLRGRSPAPAARLNEGLLSEEKQSARQLRGPCPTPRLNEGLLSEEKQSSGSAHGVITDPPPQRRASLGREAIPAARMQAQSDSGGLNEGLLSEEKQ